MRPVLTDRVTSSVGLSIDLPVGLSVTLVTPAKMAEALEMPLRTRVGASNHVLDGVQIPHGKGQF